MSLSYEIGAIVWVRLGQKWWPARVTSLEECPQQYTSELKKEPLAVVRFFNESEFHDVAKPEQIFPYNFNRKDDFIRRGLNSVKYDARLSEKFGADVAMAEKLTGGDMDIIKTFKAAPKPRIDYSDLGFGTSRPNVKRSEDKCMQREGFSDIGEAIQYKRKLSPLRERIVEHKVKIMEQPKQKGLEDDLRGPSNWFKCYSCGFTCGRLNVIIWHNKVHLKKVEDYDTGIQIPGRRKRKQKSARSRHRKKAPRTSDAGDHAHTNGHTSPNQGQQEASRLLLDWDDDDEPEEDRVETDAVDKTTEETKLNGVVEGETDEECRNDVEGEVEDAQGLGGGQRRPMPRQVDINSAFDALLADSSPLHRSRTSRAIGGHSFCPNNNSDSEGSDWEKYYARDSESEESSIAEQSFPLEPDEDVKERNGLCGVSPPTPPLPPSGTHLPFVLTRESSPAESLTEPCDRSSSPKGDAPYSRGKRNPSPSRLCPSLPEEEEEEPAEEHSSSSSSSSSSSGPAYMLVAVDAHGNNVPMPVLSEGGNHLVAVEASMEDGTTRTLYIDPAHLGPNVDLNNLMLHIDNSGQETVIIPTSTSDGEIISSTLVDQPPASSTHHEIITPTTNNNNNNNNANMESFSESSITTTTTTTFATTTPTSITFTTTTPTSTTFTTTTPTSTTITTNSDNSLRSRSPVCSSPQPTTPKETIKDND